MGGATWFAPLGIATKKSVPHILLAGKAETSTYFFYWFIPISVVQIKLCRHPKSCHHNQNVVAFVFGSKIESWFHGLLGFHKPLSQQSKSGGGKDFWRRSLSEYGSKSLSQVGRAQLGSQLTGRPLSEYRGFKVQSLSKSNRRAVLISHAMYYILTYNDNTLYKLSI